MKQKRNKRLESIKTVRKGKPSRTTEKMEDYLEVILELVEFKGYATTLDISRYMNVSAPSATSMIQKLDDSGYLKYEKYHGINLTRTGTELANTIRQKHGILLEFFEILGIDHSTANIDAEGAEHHLAPKTSNQLRKFVTYLRANPKIIASFMDLQ